MLPRGWARHGALAAKASGAFAPPDSRGWLPNINPLFANFHKKSGVSGGGQEKS